MYILDFYGTFYVIKLNRGQTNAHISQKSTNVIHDNDND